MFVETGVSKRPIFRKMFSDRREAIRDFNKWKHISNIYHSVYYYEKKEKKYDIDGNFKRWGPNYTTAIIDKIVFDLDSYEKNGTEQHYNQSGIESIRRFANWCRNKGYARRYVFSGGGFYGIIEAKGHPLKLREAMFYIEKEAGLDVDPSVIGDTGRMMRVLNSFNFKQHRQRYCIPLKEEEVFLEWDEICELAKSPRIRSKFLYEGKVFKIDRFRIDQNKVKRKQLSVEIKKNPDANEILGMYGRTLDDLCPAMKHLLSRDHVGHYYRYELIKYFKSVFYIEYEDTVNLLAALLKGEGMHSLVEGQAKFVYTKDRVFNPYKLKKIGICPENCHKCLRLRTRSLF